MTNNQMIEAQGKSVRVVANDYSYEGKIVSVFQKRSEAWRCVVEDDNGRLFIHNAMQVHQR